MPIVFKLVLTLLLAFFVITCPAWPFWETRWALWHKVWNVFIGAATAALLAFCVTLIWL
jgi:hypothetical protein